MSIAVKSPAMPLVRADAVVYLVIGIVGVAAWWFNTYRAAAMPVWAPFEFQPLWYLSATLFGFWYVRGILHAAAAERPAIWRQVLFFLGIGAIYVVLQTRYEYLAQHMFFYNRFQHIVMHHLGPLLIAVSWPGPMLARGMPDAVLAPTRWRPVRAVMHVIQQPVIAAVLFVGLIALWLYPPVHFRAMIDPRLYLFMNWTMVADGLLFWCLVLDPRGSPPARTGFAARAIAGLIVMFPQIAIGATIAFARDDLYGFYAWCGRLYPAIGPLDDQQYGGLIVWIPAAMMSVIAVVLVLDNMRRHDEARFREKEETDPDDIAFVASSWTGR